MATTTGTAPDEQRGLELAGVIENLSSQVHALADAGGRESERAAVLASTTRQIQAAVAGSAPRQGTGAAQGGERHESNPLFGKTNVAPEGLTNRTSFKHKSSRYKLVAGAKDERFKVFLD